MADKGLFASAIAKLLPATDSMNRKFAPAYAYGPQATPRRHALDVQQFNRRSR